MIASKNKTARVFDPFTYPQQGVSANFFWPGCDCCSDDPCCDGMCFTFNPATPAGVCCNGFNEIRTLTLNLGVKFGVAKPVGCPDFDESGSGLVNCQWRSGTFSSGCSNLMEWWLSGHTNAGNATPYRLFLFDHTGFCGGDCLQAYYYSQELNCSGVTVFTQCFIQEGFGGLCPLPLELALTAVECP